MYTYRCSPVQTINVYMDCIVLDSEIGSVKFSKFLRPRYDYIITLVYKLLIVISNNHKNIDNNIIIFIMYVIFVYYISQFIHNIHITYGFLNISSDYILQVI